MKFFDRLLTIIITATLTSAVWIVFGEPLLGFGRGGDETSTASTAAEAPGEIEQALEADDTRRDPAATPTAADAPAAFAAPRTEIDNRTALVIPVRGVEPAALTDSFMDKRGENDVRLHEAIDIMAPTGTDVIAAAPGTIARLHVSPAGGNTIYLRSEDKETIHFYAHLDRYASGLREGQRVARGQKIGTVGSTGNAEADAPHLHFAILRTTADAEWWEPANAVNPYPLLRAAE